MNDQKLFPWLSEALPKIWASDYANEKFLDTTVSSRTLPQVIKGDIFLHTAFAESDPVFSDTTVVHVTIPHTECTFSYPNLKMQWKPISGSQYSTIEETAYCLFHPNPKLKTQIENISISEREYNDLLSMALELDWFIGISEPADFQIETALKILSAFKESPRYWQGFYQKEGQFLYRWIEGLFS